MEWIIGHLFEGQTEKWLNGESLESTKTTLGIIA